MLEPWFGRLFEQMEECGLPADASTVIHQEYIDQAYWQAVAEEKRK